MAPKSRSRGASGSATIRNDGVGDTNCGLKPSNNSPKNSYTCVYGCVCMRSRHMWLLVREQVVWGVRWLRRRDCLSFVCVCRLNDCG